MAETKKLSDFELYQKFETHSKRKKDTKKRFLTKSKGCRDEEI